jgi:splicing factor U2AF subunit
MQNQHKKFIFSEVGKENDMEQRHFDEFYEEVFIEMERKYGPVEELNVCENIGEHMVHILTEKRE